MRDRTGAGWQADLSVCWPKSEVTIDLGKEINNLKKSIFTK